MTLKIEINGEPRRKNKWRFDEGKFRIRHDLIMDELERVLKERHIEYRRFTDHGGLNKPVGHSWHIPQECILEKCDVIRINDTYTYRDREYRFLFHVKSAEASRASYNCRAGLALLFCVRDDSVVNFKGFRPNSYQGWDMDRFGLSHTFYSFTDEDENGFVDVESLVDKMLAVKDDVDKHLDDIKKARFQKGILMNTIRSVVNEEVKKINEGGGVSGTKIVEMKMPDKYSWDARPSGELNPEFSVVVAMEKKNQELRVTFKSKIGYGWNNNSESFFEVDQRNFESVKKGIPNIIQNGLQQFHVWGGILNEN